MAGREVARRAADSVFAAALAGRGRLLLVAGEAGIGKTTLARAVAEDAQGRGAQVRWGACWEGGTLLPFGVWIDALRRPGRDACGAVSTLLADGTGPGGGPGSGPSAGPGAEADAAAAARARLRLFGQVVDALGQAAAEQPQVVVLEDLHWADASSLELLRAVAPHLASMAALLVATYRDDELDVEATGIAGLGGAAEWLTLGGLPEPDVASLLADVLGREPSPDEVRAVHAQTAGNPLFATQVGRLLAVGSPAAVPGVPAAAPATVPAAVPAGVREVLARRLARLSPDCDRILAAAAVLGTAFDVGTVVAVSGQPDDVVVAALDEAARARIALPVEGRPDRWAFVHDLVRATRYAALGAGERAALHRRALDVLDARDVFDAVGHPSGNDAPDAPRRAPAGVLAHHAANARFDPDDVRPAALAVGAAQEALARLAWREASTLAERAREAAPPGAEGDRWRAEAWLAAGDARLRTGDEDGAAAAFEEAAALARRSQRCDLLARAALGFAAGLASFEVPLMERRQIALLEEATEALAEDAPLRPLVLARLSVALSLLGADDRRLRLADDAVGLARAHRDVPALAAALAARCDAIAGPGHVAERLEAATEVVALAGRAGDVGLELLGRRHRVVALLELRDLTGFDAEVAAFAAGADRLGDPLYAWYVPLWRAMRAHADGRLDEAEALAREARAIGEAGGSANAPLLERVLALCLAGDRGDAQGLDAALHDMVAAHPELLTLPLRHILGAWADAEADRPDRARRGLAALTDAELAQLPRDQEWLATLAELVLAAAAVGDRRLLRVAYDQLLPYAGLGCFEGLAAVDRGVVDRFLTLAAGHLGDVAAVERHAPAALAGGEASGALIAAHAVADCARAYAAAGAASRAAELAADAVDRYAALGLDRRAERLRALVAPAGVDTDAPEAGTAGPHTGTAGPHTGTAGPDAGTAALVRDGDTWAVTYAGRTVRVRHAKGVADLAVLLAQPERQVHVRTLAGPAAPPPGAAQPALDDAAIRAYRARLRDLEAELDEADRHADIERAAKLAAERDALVDELTRGIGLGGRRRPFAGDPDERLRKAVSARIKASIDRLEGLHPALGRHLRHAVRTGYWCVYAPEQPVTWHVEGPRPG